MKYTDIFEEVTLITRLDYAGNEDKKGWDNSPYFMDIIKDLDNKSLLTPMEFSNLVNEYLLDFEDKHMYFTFNNEYTFSNKTCGFNIKRYNDALYVTETREEKRIKKGTKIISIDGVSIKDIDDKEYKILRESIHERQHWSVLLNRASFIEYINEQNQVKRLSLVNYTFEKLDDNFDCQLINNETLYLKIPNLVENEKVSSIVMNAVEKLPVIKYLLLDLRGNTGGNGNLLLPLEKFIFPPNEKPNTKIKQRLFNCTSRNVDLFLKLCDETRKVVNDKETLLMLELAESQFRENRGKGFVEIDFSSLISTLGEEFVGSQTPEKVIILMDYHTASAAEEFIEGCKSSSKVTTIGRSTMGINNYSDLVTMTWGKEFQFSYPISKVKNKAVYHHIHGNGIVPDIYIPWTPKFVGQDKDLEKALEVLNANRSSNR